MLRLLYFSALFICVYSSSMDEYWNVNNSKGLMKWQNLKFRRLALAPTVTRVREDQALSSCYEVECQGNQCPKADTPEAKYSFCYPSVIVTGIAKCGTSAMYSLLSKFPNAMLMTEKENCPFTRRRSHWKVRHDDASVHYPLLPFFLHSHLPRYYTMPISLCIHSFTPTFACIHSQQFLNSLPRYDSVTADTIIVDGCIHLLNNMMMVRR